MKLALDMRHMAGHMHGMTRYAVELSKAMLDLEPELYITAILRKRELAADLPDHPRLKSVVKNWAPYGLQAQLLLPGFLKRLDPDIYHCPFYGPPARYNGPMVFTIHDLIHLLFPKDYSWRHRLYYKLVVGPAAAKAGRVFTVSHHSAVDISRLLRVPMGKIVVTYNGVSPVYHPLDEEGVKKAHMLGLPPRYILGVGNPKPHKNLDGLIEAHRLLPKFLPEGVAAPPLVLVGLKTRDLAQPLSKEVLVLESLSEPDLAMAYGAASLAVIPSLYEGFGLPALEAMAAGAPVLAANRASLPEVVGAAGLLCQPDPEGIAQGMAQILLDPELRAKLAAAGPVQASRFTWSSAAHQTLLAYEMVARR